MSTLVQLRQYRLGPFAAVDTLGTLVAVYIVREYFDTSFWKSAVASYTLGEVVHLASGTKTPFTEWLQHRR